SALQTNAWNTLTVTVPGNAATPLYSLGVQFATSAAWTGTCYVDSINWSVSAPAAPTDLIAGGASGEVALGWDVSPVATSYNVLRSTSASGPFATLGTSTINNYADLTVTNGSTYYYEVTAVNSASTSAPSNVASATPVADISDDSPYNFEGSAQGWTSSGGMITGAASSPAEAYLGAASLAVTINGGGADSQTVSVSTPATPAGDIVTYHVWIPSGSAISFIQPFVLQNGSGNWLWTGNTVGIAQLQTNAWNTVTVDVPANAATPLYSLGVQFATSAAWSGTCYVDSITWSSIPPPTGLTAVAANEQVALSWTASTGATSYDVYRSTTSSGEGLTSIGTTTGTTYTDTGLTNGVTYFYSVAAVTSAGTSALSNEASATPGLLPMPPTGLTATAGNLEVALAWTAGAGATSYNIYRATASSAEGSTPVGMATGTSYSDTGLSNGVAYFYKVASVNSTGTSPQSTEASATPEPPIPAVPVVTATALDAQVDLTWTADPDATSYNIYRSTKSGAEGATPIGTAAPDGYVDTGLTNGVTYFYEATAVNSAGTSALSSEVSAVPEPPIHVQWSEAGGALSIWNYYPLSGAFIQNTYGPFAAWTPQSIADGPDGLTRVLWVNTSGAASIWSVDNTTGALTQYTFGPYPGWIATGLTVAPDNTTHVLWWSSKGQADIWNYNTGTGGYTQHSFGPFAHWSANAIADGPDGLTRLLWMNSGGTASLWSVNGTTGAFTQYSYGPYPSWGAFAMSVNADNTTHVLWTNPSGAASLWAVSPTTGSFGEYTYGPYPGTGPVADWNAVSLTDGPDGDTQVLWDSKGAAASIWDVNDSTGEYLEYTFGPYADWTAAALSSTP
ncbi:MAG: fibronectin type III domain-containing protein, partial [Capsulimonadaceae bacterium]